MVVSLRCALYNASPSQGFAQVLAHALGTCGVSIDEMSDGETNTSTDATVALFNPYPTPFETDATAASCQAMTARLNRFVLACAGRPHAVVLSSGDVFGEGPYFCPDCGPPSQPIVRSPEGLEALRWDPRCPVCGDLLMPLPARPTDALVQTGVGNQTFLALEQAVAMARWPCPVTLVRVPTPLWDLLDPLDPLDSGVDEAVDPLCQTVWQRFVAQARAGQVLQVHEGGCGMRELIAVEPLAEALAEVLAAVLGPSSSASETLSTLGSLSRLTTLGTVGSVSAIHVVHVVHGEVGTLFDWACRAVAFAGNPAADIEVTGTWLPGRPRHRLLG
ncbi:MAG: hypothetical protein KC475_02185 [Cyanobacteria bacterium HKST-UBA03]|nr:hypothetical protein [Cyanobacteria bacterium HKST-UBA03]